MTTTQAPIPLFHENLVIRNNKHQAYSFVKVTPVSPQQATIQIFEYERGPEKSKFMLNTELYSYVFHHLSKEKFISVEEVSKKTRANKSLFAIKGNSRSVSAFKSYMIRNGYFEADDFTVFKTKMLQATAKQTGSVSTSRSTSAATGERDLENKVLALWTIGDMDYFLRQLTIFDEQGNALASAADMVNDDGSSFSLQFLEICPSGNALLYLTEEDLRPLTADKVFISQLMLEFQSVKEAGKFESARRMIFEKLLCSGYKDWEKAMNVAKTMCSAKGIRRQFLNLDNVEAGVFEVKFFISLETNTLKRLLSPLLHLTGASSLIGATWGLVHSGIIVGPWVIDWVDSSLCVPRPQASGGENVMLVVDLEQSFDSRDEESKILLDKFLDNLSQVIVHYNATKIYSLSKCNCQDFTLDLLVRVGIEPAFSKVVTAFVEEIAKTGKPEMILNVKECSETFKQQHAKVTQSPEFLAKFPSSKFKYSTSSIKFYSHEQLDYYVLAMDVIGNKQHWHGEYLLLKAFDHAFAMRLFKHQRKEQQDPEALARYKALDGRCPFE